MGNNSRLYPIEEGGKWGFINAAGKIVVEPRYGTVRYVHDGVAWVNEGGTKQYMVMHTGGEWGIINEEGEFTLDAKYDKIIGPPPYLWLKTGEIWQIYHYETKHLVTPDRSSLPFDPVDSFRGEYAEVAKATMVL